MAYLTAGERQALRVLHHHGGTLTIRKDDRTQRPLWYALLHLATLEIVTEGGQTNQTVTYREPRPAQLFHPGLVVVWIPEAGAGGIAAEVVQVRRRRVEIRVQDPVGEAVLCWVRPECLRPGPSGDRTAAEG